MPLYEYKCDSCGATFEIIQRFSDPPVTACRQCGAPVHKVLSAPAIQFKGSGWYVTDYARGGSEAGKARNGRSSTSGEPAKAAGGGASTPAAAPTDTTKKAD